MNRHKRTFNRDASMIEEHKGSAVDNDSDEETTSKLIKVRRGQKSSKAEAEFEEGDCESDYED